MRNRARCKIKAGRSKLSQQKKYDENHMAENLDLLAQFEGFTKDIPKALREALLSGADASALYEQYASIAAVRVVQILTTEPDSSKALAAAKELLDRTYGKAKETREVKHSMQKVTDDELDSMIISLEAEASEED